MRIQKRWLFFRQPISLRRGDILLNAIGITLGFLSLVVYVFSKCTEDAGSMSLACTLLTIISLICVNISLLVAKPHVLVNLSSGYISIGRPYSLYKFKLEELSKAEAIGDHIIIVLKNRPRAFPLSDYSGFDMVAFCDLLNTLKDTNMGLEEIEKRREEFALTLYSKNVVFYGMTLAETLLNATAIVVITVFLASILYRIISR